MKPIPISKLIGRVDGFGERESAIIAKEVGDDLRKLKDWMLSHDKPQGDIGVLIPEYFKGSKGQEYMDKRDRLSMLVNEMIAEAKFAAKDEKLKGGSGVSGASPSEGKVPGSSPGSRTTNAATFTPADVPTLKTASKALKAAGRKIGKKRPVDESKRTPRPTQTDLAGQKLEVKEFLITKESIIYQAQHYQVSVSQDEDALDRLSALDAGDRMPWLKARMRVLKGHDPDGSDMDADAKVLFASVFC